MQAENHAGDTEDYDPADNDGSGEVTERSPEFRKGLEIESDVPIPKVVRRKYPFNKMRPGDSFEIRADRKTIAEVGEKVALQRLRSSLSSSAASYTKRNPRFKLVVRKTGPGLLRCWAVQKDNDE